MTERELLEREVFELSRIIQTNIDALAKELAALADRPALQRQTDLRRQRLKELQERLAGLGNQA